MRNRMLFLILVPWLTCTAGASDPENPQQARREAEQAQHEMAEARKELAAAAQRLAEAQRKLSMERGDAVGPVFFHRAPAMSFEGQADDKHYSILFRPGPGQPLPRSWIGVVLGEDQGAGGVPVAGLTPGGPARRAGLERGDLIVSFNGQTLGNEGAHELRELLKETEPGETITLEVIRGDERLELDVEPGAPGMHLGIDLEDLKQRLEEGLPHVANLVMPGGDDAPFQGLRNMTIRLPAMAKTLGPGSNLVANHDGLAPYFGTAEGILVVRIDADNPFGLLSGDVILKINDQVVARPADIAQRLMSIEPGDTVILDIVREGLDRTLDAQMPERSIGRIGALIRGSGI